MMFLVWFGISLLTTFKGSGSLSVIIIAFILYILNPFYYSFLLLILLLLINAIRTSVGAFATYGEDPAKLSTPSFFNVFKVYCYSAGAVYIYYIVSAIISLAVSPVLFPIFSGILTLAAFIHLMIILVVGLTTYERFSGLQIVLGYLMLFGTIYFLSNLLLSTLVSSYLHVDIGPILK